MVVVSFENTAMLWGVSNKKVFYLGAREFRLRDAWTSLIHLELIRYKIDVL